MEVDPPQLCRGALFATRWAELVALVDPVLDAAGAEEVSAGGRADVLEVLQAWSFGSGSQGAIQHSGTRILGSK